MKDSSSQFEVGKAIEMIVTFCLGFPPLEERFREVRKRAVDLMLDLECLSQKLIWQCEGVLRDQDMS